MLERVKSRGWGMGYGEWGILLSILCSLLMAFSGCASMAASAEEYYSIVMAYFDLGKFDEAEKWLNRARMADKTRVASEYNLGRIAFETKRYEEAARHFESILKRDSRNVLALKAAAYTRIKTGEIALAEKHYNILLSLVPESADDGYNYALVLFAMARYADAEKILAANQFALLDNNEILLLYARSQKAQDKVEAIDSYAKWLANNSDPKVRYEYAQMLEKEELYARALEEYRLCLSGLAPNSVDIQKSDLRFAIARLLLTADSGNAEGINELRSAVSEGYNDIESIEALLGDKRISGAGAVSLRAVINELQRSAENAAKAAAGLEAEVKAGSDSAGE